VVDKDGGVAGSRIGHTIGKFLPFSILGWARSKDAAPWHVFAAVSKGMSYGRAVEAYQGVLETWARKDAYSRVYNNPKVRANLEALGDGVLEAAVKNGYDPRKLVDTAKAGVVKRIYADMFQAIDRQDRKAVEELARQLHRVNGKVNNLRSSVKSRNRNYGRPAKLTEDQKRMIAEAFARP